MSLNECKTPEYNRVAITAIIQIPGVLKKYVVPFKNILNLSYRFTWDPLLCAAFVVGVVQFGYYYSVGVFYKGFLFLLSCSASPIRSPSGPRI